MVAQPVFRLRIQLEEVTPTVWRRLLVPGGVRLPRLHDMFQAAMGWTDSHLHQFRIEDRLYGMHFDDWPDDELDEKDYTVSMALRGRVKRFGYDYDFGDSWEHEVVVEDFSLAPTALKFGVCLDGQNACPPEDVGGPPGYEEFLEALADPLHEDHDRYLVWVGFQFDRAAFDVAEANVRLQRVR
ncbi:MAG TPA: plasmid pRiA4b ORF-3 family protein [Actinomycetota bacterium]|nr:plasmid pRiA4b ORF-3 family protein [Actinomycetota bacterium]